MRLAKFSFIALIGSIFFFCMGCSNSNNGSATNSSSSDSTLNTSVSVGNSVNYSGTETVQITFVAPTSTESNSFAAYTTSESDVIQSAASGAPAPIDIHKVITYTAAQAPVYGTEPQTKIVDEYAVTTSSANSASVSILETVSSDTSIDVTAGLVAPAGAPYTSNGTSTTTYTTPSASLTLPLVAGTTWSHSLARTVNDVTSVVDASSNVYAQSNLTTAYNGDGSYSESGQNTLTTTIGLTLSSDGTGARYTSDLSTGNLILFETIGAPTASASGYVIPFTGIKSATGHVSQYQAADWFPGGGLINQPLESQSSVVIGVVSYLPVDCAYNGSQTNLTEYDSTSSKIDPLKGTYVQTNSRTFVNSSGLMVCSLTNSTTQSYNLKTGTLIKTAVVNSTNSLND